MVNNIESGITIGVEEIDGHTTIRGEFSMSVILSTEVKDNVDVELAKEYLRTKLKDETIRVLADNIYKESERDRVLGCKVYDSDSVERGEMLMIINRGDHVRLIKDRIKELLKKD